MENGIYMLSAKNAVCARGVECKDGKFRGLSMTERLVHGSVQYYWTNPSAWNDLTEKYVSGLAGKSVSEVTEIA